MKADQRTILSRLDYIREQVVLLQTLADDPQTLEEVRHNPFASKGIVYMLQTSVEAMMDIAFHLCAKLYATAPDNGIHSFEILAEHGDLPKGKLPVFRMMVKFRNLVVHGYLHTNPGIVSEIVRNHLSDFRQWETLILKVLDRMRTAEGSE